MYNQTSKLTAVIVTYTSGRAEMAQTAVRSALDNGCDRVVLVLNGVDKESQAAHENASRLDRRLELLDLGQNLGATAGFDYGTNHALRNADAVLLLDDDNELLLPVLDLSILEITQSSLAGLLRIGRKPYDRRAGGLGFPAASSILSFDLTERVFRSSRRIASPRQPLEPVPVPYLPFGGMLLSRQIRRELGGFDLTYRNYGGDTRYCLDASMIGIPVVMLAGDWIREQEQSFVARSRHALRELVRTDSDRAVESIRSNVRNDRVRGQDCQLLQRLNLAVVLLVVILSPTRSSVRSRVSAARNITWVFRK